MRVLLTSLPATGHFMGEDACLAEMAIGGGVAAVMGTFAVDDVTTTFGIWIRASD